jgi:hypothetical protein
VLGFIYNYPECHIAERCLAECRYAECCHAECCFALSHYTECCYAVAPLSLAHVHRHYLLSAQKFKM